MKKIISIPVIVAIFLLTGCASQKTPSKNNITPKNPSQPYIIQDTKVNIAGNYLGSEYKGNYIWGGAMNLAWNDLKEQLEKDVELINCDDETALRMLDVFNKSLFTKKDLDEESYYIKVIQGTGEGSDTADLLNNEAREKFNGKSLSDLNFSLGIPELHTIFYAYFIKELEYKSKFDKKVVLFEGKKVKGFYAKELEQKRNIQIIKYENDDGFIISLKLKDENDQLILAKGYDMNDPQIAIDEINQNNKNYQRSIEEQDTFEAPKLKLSYKRDYVELIGETIASSGIVANMFENIIFSMDEKGARVENEALIDIKVKSEPMEQEKSKNFILNKPYWVIMKRADSQNPYFILGVNNTELMEK